MRLCFNMFDIDKFINYQHHIILNEYICYGPIRKGTQYFRDV